MTKTMTKLCFLSLMTLGFAACTEDPASNNGSTTPADMGTTPVDMPVAVVDMDKPDSAPAVDMPAKMDMADMADKPDMVVEETGCGGANPPARCSADRDTFSDWAPASVISRLELTTAADCCYDYTGDGEINNALGNTVDQLGGNFGFGLADINESLATAIAEGTVALVLEHEGVMPGVGGPFAINFMLGEPQGFTGPSADGGNDYKIDPISFEAGVWPQARINDATLTGTAVTTGQGTVAVALNLLGVSLTLRISAAKIEATVVSADAKGVALSKGKLGGALRIDDLVSAVNDFVDANCGCLGIKEGKFINGSLVDGYTCADVGDTTCNADNGGSEGICAQTSTICTVVPVLASLADVNSSNVGKPCVDEESCDAISVGFTFDAVGAVISGVAAAQ